jgi:hypothetical protein
VSPTQEPKGEALHPDRDRSTGERIEQAERLRREFRAAARANLEQARSLAERLAGTELLRHRRA